MTREDARRWDVRHAAVGQVVPMPPDALRGREGLLPAAGRALDVACGRGAVAWWLAGRGFAVDAVDVSPVALAAAAVGPLPHAAADRRSPSAATGGAPPDAAAAAPRPSVVPAAVGVGSDLLTSGRPPVAGAGSDRPAAGPAVRWLAHDLDAGLPDSCAGPYDVIVCQRFRDPALYGPMRARLAPGGLLVITVLSEVGEGSGAYRAPAGELLAAFGDLDVVLHREDRGEATLVAFRPVGSPGSRPTPPAPS